MTAPRATARVIAIAAATGLLGSGCGGSPSALQQTADHLADIHSGTLSLRFSLKPTGAQRGIGVALDGPFSLAGSGPLPVARIAYSERAAATRRATFISTGKQAFVKTAGRTVRLPPDRLAGLRIGSGSDRSLEDLGLDVGHWLKDTKTSPGPRLAGQPTELITGTLNVSEALGDLAPLLGGAAELSREDTHRLSQTVSDSAVSILTGKQDHLLRRLRLSITLAVPPDLRTRVGGRHGLQINIRMGISRHNRRVEVAAPAPVPPR